MISHSRTLATLALATGIAANAPALAQSSLTAAPPARPAAAQQAAPDAGVIFSRWDTDKNKSLSAAEFRTGWEEMQLSLVLRKLQANFQTMDANKSGALEASEYAQLELVRKAGKSAPMMAYYDTDKNGSLDFKEYALMVTAIMQKK